MSETMGLETVRLSPGAVDAAKRIQELSGVASIEEAIRLALGDELYFREKVNAGFRVFVTKGDVYREVDLSTDRRAG